VRPARSIGKGRDVGISSMPKKFDMFSTVRRKTEGMGKKRSGAMENSEASSHQKKKKLAAGRSTRKKSFNRDRGGKNRAIPTKKMYSGRENRVKRKVSIAQKNGLCPWKKNPQKVPLFQGFVSP